MAKDNGNYLTFTSEIAQLAKYHSFFMVAKNAQQKIHHLIHPLKVYFEFLEYNGVGKPICLPSCGTVNTGF